MPSGIRVLSEDMSAGRSIAGVVIENPFSHVG
jgi:hypothetical protein